MINKLMWKAFSISSAIKVTGVKWFWRWLLDAEQFAGVEWLLYSAEIRIVGERGRSKLCSFSLNANRKIGIKASQCLEPRNSFLISYHSLLSSGSLLKADGVEWQLNISAIRSISHNYPLCRLIPWCCWKSGQSWCISWLILLECRAVCLGFIERIQHMSALITLFYKKVLQISQCNNISVSHAWRILFCYVQVYCRRSPVFFRDPSFRRPVLEVDG